MEFLEVTLDKIKELAELSSEIWHEYWPCILSDEQIDYMVDKFQSEHAMLEQIKKENSTYYCIVKDGNKCGYFGISQKKDYPSAGMHFSVRWKSVKPMHFADLRIIPAFSEHLKKNMGFHRKNIGNCTD